MNDRRRSCLGLIFLSASFILALVALLWGWIGWDLRTGAILSGAFFSIFVVLAAYMFMTIRDYAWLPAVFGGIYAILPDLFVGPADDLGVLALGALISGIWSWRRSKREQSEKIPQDIQQ